VNNSGRDRAVSTHYIRLPRQARDLTISKALSLVEGRVPPSAVIPTFYETVNLKP
jgi:hypothetical protein